jgi:prephenate dehydrogenase
MTVGIIGLGLIGGSIARAVRKKYPDTKIIAYNRKQEVLKTAEEDGVISEGIPFVNTELSECDFIFLCTPVVTSLAYLDELKEIMKPGAILTDVGSTKTAIHEEIKRRGMQDRFIGGHPMTGSEKTGYANSKAIFLENAYYLLTPGEDVPIERVGAFQEFIAGLGSLPLILTYEEHDRIAACISHLPHVISASLVNMVHDQDGAEHLMKTIAAGGFKDITRISSSSPKMWQEICLANREELLRALDIYIRQLMAYRASIDTKNASSLLKIFTDCKEYRDSFSDESAGVIKKEYRIYCDVADEKGSIAKVAVLLADNDVSMKNIGILHNREFEQGVLKVLFYDQESADRAAEVLKKAGYTVYEN